MIYVANRTFKRAEKLAEELNGFAVRYDEKDKYTACSDMVISATPMPHAVLTAEMLRQIMKNHSDMVISATPMPHAVLTAEMLRQIMKNHDHDLLLLGIATPGDIEEVASDLRGQTDIRILLLIM